MLEHLRVTDYDRYLSVLFASPEARPHLAALYAFNFEVAKTWESVSQPIAGQIRLQWWRDAIDELYRGQVRAHEVVQALAATLRAHDLPRELFDAIIDAREHDLEDTPFVTLEALEAYCDATSGNVMRLALRILGAGDAFDAPARAAGIAYALTGLLRALPLHASRRRLMLPMSLVNVDDVFAGHAGGRLPAAIAAVAQSARAHLKTLRTRRIPRRVLPALLPAATTPIYLNGMTQRDFNSFRDAADVPLYRRQWAMLAAVMRGTI